MKSYAYVTSIAMAVAGVSFTGCDRDDTAVNDRTPQTEVGRDLDRAADATIRGGEEVAADVKAGAQAAGEEAREAGAEVRQETREAGRDTRDAMNNAGNEMDRAGDRTADAARDAGRDVNRNVNATARDANARANGATTVAPNGTAAAPDAEGIRDVLGQIPEAALAKDGFDDLVERFVDADRNRIGKWMEGNKDFSQLNTKAEQLSQKSQAKYNAEFDIKDEGKLYNEQFASIQQTETTDAQAAAARDDGDANKDDAGRNKSTIRIQESHGLPALTVNMLHEFPGVWKIDVPDQVTGQQLHDNVNKALDEIARKEGQWPDNADEAKRFITHRLLLAIHGQQMN